MSFATILLSETEHVVNELPMPSIMFGVIAMIIFIFLGAVTFTYRDVANRHSHKAQSQAGHDAAGHDAAGHGH